MRHVLAPSVHPGEVIEGSTVDDDSRTSRTWGLIRLQGVARGRRPTRSTGRSRRSPARGRPRSTADGVVPSADGSLDMGKLMAGWRSFLAGGRSPRGGGASLQGSRAPPDADGLPPARGQRRRTHLDREYGRALESAGDGRTTLRHRAQSGTATRARWRGGVAQYRGLLSLALKEAAARCSTAEERALVEATNKPAPARSRCASWVSWR